MTSRTAVGPNLSPQWNLTPALLGKAGVIAVLFVALHFRVLQLLYTTGLTDRNWSHILLIPFISLYMVFHRRHELLRIRPQTDLRGSIPMIVGFVGYTLSLNRHTTMGMGYSMILTLLGVVWLNVGWEMVRRVLWLPIAYLVFAVKFTYVYDRISFYLQHVAAAGGAFMATVVGLLFEVEAEAQGAIIHVYHKALRLTPPLDVEEACSGLRSLMALLALSVAMAYLEKRPLWARIGLVVCAVPVAVGVNIGRITITALLYPFYREFTRGGFHELTGMLMLVPAMLILFGIMRLMDWVAAESDIDSSRPGE